MSERIQSKEMERFTQVSNRAVRDEELGAVSLAIYTYIRSHCSQNFKIYKKNIQERFSEIGRVSFDRAWKALIEKGWIESKRVQDSNGRYTAWEHQVAVENDDYILNDNGKSVRVADMHPDDIRSADSRSAESRSDDTLKKNNSKNTKSKKTKAKQKEASPSVVCPPFIDQDLWDEYLSTRKRVKASNTPRALNTLVNKLNEIEKGSAGDGQRALENANEAGWKSVYPVDNRNVAASRKRGPSSRSDQRTQRNVEVFEQVEREEKERAQRAIQTPLNDPMSVWGVTIDG